MLDSTKVIAGSTTTRQPESRAFFASLESLRGAAALLVALYHVSWLNPLHGAGVVRNSYLMVDLFFVLSGFVLCHGYRDRIRNRDDFRDFFILRLGRLYPLHFAVLMVFVAREAARYGAQHWFNVSLAVPAFAENTGWAFLSNLLLMQSLGLHDRLTFNAPSWSISTEFYSYLAFAIVVVAIRKRSAQLTTFLALCGLSFGVLFWVGRTDLNVMYDFGLFRCTMGFFAGAAAYLAFARLQEFCPERTLRRLAPYLAAASLVASAIFLAVKSRGGSDFLFPPLAVIVVVALAACPQAAINRWLEIRPLTHLGKISYSIYMVHFFLSLLVGSVLVSRFGYGTSMFKRGEEVIATGLIAGTIALVLYVGLVLAVSHFTFVYIEEPFRQKAKAWVRSRQNHRAPAQRTAQPDKLASLRLS